jgi:hypothetical protein
VYDKLFGCYRGEKITFVEVGVLGGGSLQAWRDYFGPAARIVGVDLNPAIAPLLMADGFEIQIGDQASPAFWNKFFESVSAIDILLDDGGHSNMQTWVTCRAVVPRVRDGGMVVIEDTHASYLSDFGNPSEASLVSRAKRVVDVVHRRATRSPESDLRRIRARDVPTDWVDAIHEVRFFESLVAFSVDRSLCKKSRELRYGSCGALPTGVVPEDFRYQSVGAPVHSGLGEWARRGIQWVKRAIRADIGQTR